MIPKVEIIPDSGNIICPQCNSQCSREALYCSRCYLSLKYDKNHRHPNLLDSKGSLILRQKLLPKLIISLAFGGFLIWTTHWMISQTIEYKKALSERMQTDIKTYSHGILLRQDVKHTSSQARKDSIEPEEVK